MIRILHFADAHIDISTQGRHDPASGLPVRVLDFLEALDTIVDTGIREKVDLVIFAGDAYKDRTPVPTFQREWGKRILRLSQAGIPTILLVGNHDLSPATGRAHALQEFQTLQIPHVRVIDRPCFLSSEDLGGLPLQVIGLPWVSRSSLIALLKSDSDQPFKVYEELQSRFSELVNLWLEQANPDLPVVLTAHATVQGAVTGFERYVMLGGDLVLPGSIVKDQRLDYSALGHIHKAQDLHEGMHPPVVYPGSIERVDFNEAADDKFFVIANVERGNTRIEWRKLKGRKFIDCAVKIEKSDNILDQILAAFPPKEELAEAVVRLVVDYPREIETMIDETALRRYAAEALEFHFVRKPQVVARLRLPGDTAISTYSPLELLDLYWQTIKVNGEEADLLDRMAAEIISGSGETAK